MNRILLSLVFLCSAASCSQPKIQSVPFERNIPESGVAREEFSVTKKQLYAVEINYKYSSAPRDRGRVWQFSGGTKSGAPFSVKSRITGLTGGPRDIEAIRPKLTSWGAESLNAEVGRVELDPGHYVIDVQLIDGRLPPNIAATFSVRRAYTGK
jgi:hypothetical protein